MKSDKVFFRNDRKENLIGILHMPNGNGKFPVVIGCHGFRADKSSGKLVALGNELPKHGIAFLRFDFSGHGESEGKFEDTTVTNQVDDLRSALDFVCGHENLDETKTGVVGSSLGGMVAVISAAEDERIKCLALLCPLSDFTIINLPQYSKEKLKEWKEKGTTLVRTFKNGTTLPIKYRFYEDGLSYDVYKTAEKVSAPTLILHGDGDDVVPLSQSQELVKHLNGEKELAIVHGASHRFEEPEHFEQVFNTVVGFMIKHLK